MREIILTDIQKDALREIGSICSGNAATALSVTWLLLKNPF